MRVAHSIAKLVFLLVMANGLYAQSNYSAVGIPQNPALIPIPSGFIDPLSTQVHLEIPLASVALRDNPPFTAKLVYDTTLYKYNGYTWGGAPGWRLVYGSGDASGLAFTATWGPCPDAGYPYGQAETVTNFYGTDIHGTVHPISWSGTLQYVSNCTNGAGQNDTTIYPSSFTAVAQDGSGYTYAASILASNGFVQTAVWDIGGALWTNEGAGNSPYGYGGSTNGTVPNDQFAQIPVTFGGNTGPCANNTNPGYVYVTVSDGSKQTTTINCAAYSVSNGVSSGTVYLPSSIVFPDGTQYGFGYDTGTTGTHPGLLTSMTLPTGGQVQFTYLAKGQSCSAYNNAFVLTSVSFGSGTRTFNPIYTCSSGTSQQAIDTVTGPSRFDSASQTWVNDKTVYTSTVSAGPPWLIQTGQSYSGSSTLLKTVGTTYTRSGFYGGPCLGSVTTTLNDTGQTSKVQYQYGSIGSYAWVACALLLQKQEYDFGAASPTRTTNISYQGDTASIKYNSQYYIYNRPASISVYAGSGTGSPASSTTYTYDEYGANYCVAAVPMLTNITGAINHDDPGHGSTFWARGNVTSISRLVSSNTWVTSHKCYDTLGNVTQNVDANGNPTNYDYTERWADASCIPAGTLTRAFPTTITDALGHRMRTTRFTCTSLVQAKAEENDIQAGRSGTTYTYDIFGRETAVNYPDGGQTISCYSNDPGAACYSASLPQFSTTSTLITTTSSKNTKTVLDSYGRVSQQQLTSDPDGTDYTDTTYDGFGRTASVSNPYRTTSDTTYGVTNYYYDALGRANSVVEPDGSKVTTAYTGNTTTVTDEIGNKRKTQTDALGRTAFVWEDPSGVNFETDYSYDVLDNLVSVTQKGSAPTDSTNWRLRTFTYDALSRLVCAANPEIQNVTCPASATGPFPTGAIVYAYDNNGNLKTKTAPSPNQAPGGTATVKTTYTYDGGNRITGKTYVDSYPSNPGTAAVEYGYDGNTLANCPAQPPPGDADNNPSGYRTAMCDGSGGTNWTHDPMGRVLQERRTIGVVSGKNETDSYNLDGSVGSINSTSYITSYTYNTAGRPITAKSSNTAPATVYVATANYAPFGGLSGATLGSTPITITNTYNSRLQPLLISAAASSTIMSLCYDFHSNASINSTQCSFTSNSGGDNGNVFKIINNRDTNRSQNFLYDSLNRISQAYTAGPNWGETFGPTATSPGVQPTSPGIDAWGNLINRSGVTGKSIYESLSASANSNNQLSGYGYDAAGNMSSNGNATYFYDAENRLIAAGGMSYFYDGDAKRVKKCTEGTTPGTCGSGATGTLYWSVFGGQTSTETDLSGTGLAHYIYFNDQRIARHDASTGAVHFYFSDHLGTHSLVTDVNGSMPAQSESDFFPYGGEIVITNNDSNHYKFTGKERGTESNLDYFGARHYASTMGRWMTPDPLNLTSARLVKPTNTLNKYVYGGNNPLKYIDRDGEDITVFYRPPSGASGDYGHIFIAALNQQTGQTGFLDYYPKNGTNSLGRGQGTFNTGDMQSRAEEAAAGKFATLTIQTSPEEAQKVLNQISAMTSGPAPNFSAILGNNCTTVCEDVLHDLGLDFGDRTPSGYWDDLYRRYSQDAADNPFKIFAPSSIIPRQTGREYGFPRYGLNYSQLLFQLYLNQWNQQHNQQKPKQKACVTAGGETTCEEYY